MLTKDLIQLREEFEFLLQQRGPVEFIRDLVATSDGAQVQPYESRPPTPTGVRATRFVYRDRQGDEAFLTISVEAGEDDGPQRLYLDCMPRDPRSAGRARRT